MRRFDPETWSGIVMFAVLLLVTGPVMFASDPARIPTPLWVGLLVLLLLSLVASFWGVDPAEDPRVTWRYLPFGAAVLASWALVLGAEGGLVPILLVITVATSPYIAPVRLAWALAACNLAVLFIAYLPLWATRDGRVELALMLVFYLLIQAAALLSSVALLREQRSRRALAAAHVELQAASALLAGSARTSERLRISRELHDLIGHQLTVLTLELEAAKHRAPEEDAALRPHLERADAVARDLLASVRETVGDMRAESIDLDETLHRVVQDLSEPRVVLRVDEGVSLDEPRTVLLVRTVQEIVTNTIRHAHAQTLTIEVRRSAGGLALRSRDDGVGARTLKLGNGLRGLRERFEAVGGSVTFDGSDGFRVTANLPVEAEEES